MNADYFALKDSYYRGWYSAQCLHKTQEQEAQIAKQDWVALAPLISDLDCCEAGFQKALQKADIHG